MATAYTEVDILMDAVDKKVDDSNGRLSKLILAVSEALDRICNRPNGFVAASIATPKLYAGRASGVLRIDECVEITAVAAKENALDTAYTAWDEGDWIAFTGDEASPDFNTTPYTGILAAPGSSRHFTGFSGGDAIAWESDRRALARSSRKRAPAPTCQVTARWGYASEVPAVIEQACIIQASRLWKRGQSAFADTLVAGEFGQQLYRVKIDQDLQLLLRDARMIRPAIG